MLPLPTVRRSTPFIRATIGPKGMLPEAKAAAAARGQKNGEGSFTVGA
jgi:hypothetical protein